MSSHSKAPLNYSNDAAKEMVDQESNDARKEETLTLLTPDPTAERARQQQEKSSNKNTNFDSSFAGLFMQQIAHMTSPIGADIASLREDASQHSHRLVEENNLLKEQLELVKQSLAEHQEKAATTEMTMMEAILQMKQQITQVISL